MRRRKRSPSPQRRIRRSSGLLTCCSDRSKYGTPESTDRVDQRVAEVARVEVEQPHPVDPVRRPPARAARWRRHRAHPGRSLPYDARSWATSTISRAPSWSTSVEDRRDVAAALRAPERRDRAEPAPAVAALGDLHVGPRHRRLRAGQVEQVERRDRNGADRDQLARRRSARRGRLGEPTPKPATWSTSGSAAASSSP